MRQDSAWAAPEKRIVLMRAINRREARLDAARARSDSGAKPQSREDSAMTTLTLYNAPQSTCSQRVRFVLNAKGLPFTEHRLDLLAGDQIKPDYLKLNP